MLSKYDIKIILKNRRNIVLAIINILLLWCYVFLVSEKNAYLWWYYVKIYNLVIPCIILMAQSNNFQTYMHPYALMRFMKVEDAYKKILECDLFVLMIFWLINIIFNLGMIGIYGFESPELIGGFILMMLIWPIFMTMFKQELYIQIKNYRRANIICIIIWLIVYIIDSYNGYIFTSLSSAIVALAISIIMIFVSIMQVKNDEMNN